MPNAGHNPVVKARFCSPQCIGRPWYLCDNAMHESCFQGHTCNSIHRCMQDLHALLPLENHDVPSLHRFPRSIRLVVGKNMPYACGSCVVVTIFKTQGFWETSGGFCSHQVQHWEGHNNSTMTVCMPPTWLFCTEFYLGIIVGTWPCGTLVMEGELFGAESKAQVYGNVHTFLQSNEESTQDLGMSI